MKKLSPQNGGFIRAKSALPRTFCAKANGLFEGNPKWRIFIREKFFCQIGPLSRDTACTLRRFSELNVDNWNDNCEAKSEAKSPRPLRGLQVE